MKRHPLPDLLKGFAVRIGILWALLEEWEGDAKAESPEGGVDGGRGGAKGVRLVRFGRVGDWEGGRGRERRWAHSIH